MVVGLGHGRPLQEGPACAERTDRRAGQTMMLRGLDCGLRKVGPTEDRNDSSALGENDPSDLNRFARYSSHGSRDTSA